MEASRCVWRMPLFAPVYDTCFVPEHDVIFFFFTRSQTGNMRAACCYGNRSRANQQCSQTRRAQIRDLQKLHKFLPNYKSSTNFIIYNILIFFQPFEDYLGICFEYAFKKVTLKYKKTVKKLVLHMQINIRNAQHLF